MCTYSASTAGRVARCGGGHYPLDRVLGIEGESFTPGAASIIADAVSDSSYAEASRKLVNLAGVNLHSSRLKRAALRRVRAATRWVSG